MGKELSSLKSKQTPMVFGFLKTVGACDVSKASKAKIANRQSESATMVHKDKICNICMSFSVPKT